MSEQTTLDLEDEIQKACLAWLCQKRPCTTIGMAFRAGVEYGRAHPAARLQSFPTPDGKYVGTVCASGDHIEIVYRHAESAENGKGNQ